MFLKSSILRANHGFFTRNGGVSTGEFASLNCGPGSGDDIAKVGQNREIVIKAIGAKDLATVRQCHSDVAAIVTKPTDVEADALVTNVKGLALGILTADCVPVLFEDVSGTVVAAAHAGWKGARFGIISSTIRSMENLGATEIRAVIGPCIHQQSYEVGVEFLEVFLGEDPANNQYFERSKRENHFMFDLPSYVAAKLKKNGVDQIEILREDTMTQPDKFFSYRRMTHEGKTQYGRQISVIRL